ERRRSLARRPASCELRRPPAMAAAVTILGAGSWGSALAVHLARLGHRVTLWDRQPSRVDDLCRTRENAIHLPGVELPADVAAVASLAEACRAAQMIVFVIPSSGVRGLGEQVREVLDGEPIVVTAAKGVEQVSRLTMSAVLEAVLGPGHGAR